MAHHDFGILAAHEEENEAFYAYIPQRFHCIAVDMDAVDDCGLIPETQEMPTYLHELSRPFHGLNETGVTLIPPQSLPLLRDTAARHGLSELAALADEAYRGGCFVIHFGI